MGHHHHHHGGHHHHHHHHHHSGHYNTATVYTSTPVVVVPARPVVYTTPLLGVQKTGSSGYSHKSLVVAYILLIFFGFLGFHRLYLNKIGTFFLYFFTCGVFGIGIIYDIFVLPSLVRHYNEHSFSQSIIGGPVIYETTTVATAPYQPNPEVEIITETAPPTYQP